MKINNDEPIIRPWDPPGLPDRYTWRQRCRHHSGLCSFRDDDPTHCPACHRPWKLIAQCDCSGCRNGDGWAWTGHGKEHRHLRSSESHMPPKKRQ